MKKQLIEQLAYISNMTSEQRYTQITKIIKAYNIPCKIQKNKNARNIILFPENHDENTVVFTAHYDIVPGSSGANDNGSSVVILLNLAAFIVKQNYDVNVSIVFLDKEESGGYGCSLYFNKYHPALMVNLDVCGAGSHIVFCDETGMTNTYTKLFRQTLPVESIETDNMPYCDGRHAERMGIDVWSICVFPYSDAMKMANLRMTSEDKALIRSHAKNVPLRKYPPKCPEIYEYMHCGKYDDLFHINYGLMQEIYIWLQRVICRMQ